METWRKNRLRGAWSFAWLFAIFFHQLLPPLLRDEGINELYFVIFILYFGGITFLFTWLFFIFPEWMVAAILFFFGGFVETRLFGVLPNFWLGGLFYFLMFFIPSWLSQRMWPPVPEAEEA